MKFFKNASGIKFWIEKVGEDFWVHIKNQTLRLKKNIIPTAETSEKAQETFLTEITAPHPGRITSIPIKENDEVQKGQTLIVIEAMKMEHSIKASHSVKIKSIFVQVGQTVEFNEKIISFHKENK